MVNGKKADPYMGMDSIASRTREERFKAALEFRGNVVPLINTFRDLSAKEKADFYDDYTIRKKGRLPKTNPWRN